MSAAAFDVEEEVVNRDAIPPHGDYYVTVREDQPDRPRVAVLLGPYPDVREALSQVSKGSRAAIARDYRATWFLYGVARAPIGTNITTIFGR